MQRRFFSTLALFFLFCLTQPLFANQFATDIDRLIQQLGSSSFAEREEASQRLKAIGAPAVEALRKAARTSADAEIRFRAGQLLSGMKLPPAAFRKMPNQASKLPAKRNNEPSRAPVIKPNRVNEQAKKEIPALRRSLSDPDPAVRWRAAYTLWKVDRSLAGEAMAVIRQVGSEMEKRLPTLTTDADVQETRQLLFAALEIADGRSAR
jgi:hypothetical protein